MYRVKAAKEALEHPRRRLLLQIVEARPGVSLRQACIRSGLASGTARHHLGILKRCNLVWEDRHPGRLAFFAGPAPQCEEEILRARAAALPPRRRAVLDQVLEAPGEFQRHLIEALPFPDATVQSYLKVLAELGLVDCRRMGRRACYYPAAGVS